MEEEEEGLRRRRRLRSEGKLTLSCIVGGGGFDGTSCRANLGCRSSKRTWSMSKAVQHLAGSVSAAVSPLSPFFGSEPQRRSVDCVRWEIVRLKTRRLK
jgi:hypothetical protein